MNLINIKPGLRRCLLAVLILLLFVPGCKKTEVVDQTEFMIYYTGMTDIGPSMNGIIASPSYIGQQPNNFEIVKITKDDVVYTGDSFEINKDNGSISIQETVGIQVGFYKLTISCYANGTRHEFKDVVEVNMMKAVPDGIEVEPNKLTAIYADVIDPNSTVELPTAKVLTDNNHVSIRKYEIAKSNFSKFFAISSTGVISIVRGDAALLPGKYNLSLKLTTGASGEDQGIFENAVEVNITSKPLALTYDPALGKLEEESALSGKTSYISSMPMLKGSLDNVVYSIKSISPATDKITIDAGTGAISVAENHKLSAGQHYNITVHVKNAYDEAGVDFANVFQLDIVEFIEPIQNFAYPNKTAVQSVAFTVKPDDRFKGDEVRFEFVDLPAELIGKITLNNDGIIGATKGNTIAKGTYLVKVKASNAKGESVSSFTLTVGANPNYFTYVRYGNNLGLSPVENYANQFRIAAGGSLNDINPVPVTDAKVDLTFEIKNIHQGSGTTIDPTTGRITLKGIAAPQCGIFMVTATAGKGTPEEYIVQTPVFIHISSQIVPSSNAGQSVKIEYSPFVFQVNPNKGGRSIKPAISSTGDLSKLTLDYRRTFNYYDFDNAALNGQPSVANSFMQSVWGAYYASKSANPNYSARAPLSSYDNKDNLGLALAYVDPTTFEVVVNPNKWMMDGEPAHGAMIGQVTMETNGADPQGSTGQAFPMILWFDTKF